MKVRIRKWMSAVISAAMVVTSISTVAFAADTTQKVIIDDNFNSVSLDGEKQGMNGAWKNMGFGWSNMEPEKRAEGDICWKWLKGYNIYDPLESWEQIFVDMDALKATDTLNISYDLKLGNGATTKSIVVLDGGTNNVEYIQLGETGQGGIYHVGTTQWVDNNQATAGGEDIKRDDWVKVDITVKDSKTSIKVDGTELCKDITPPAGQTFNQAGVNKVRFATDGIDNSNKINVRIDNVKITVDSKSGGETPETPDKPDTPSGDVLLSENFDRYEIGQTANDTFCKDDANWDKFFSEVTSTIVAGETGHGNALELKNNGDCPQNINFEYKNMTISKQYAVIDTMFKGKASCNFDIQIVNGESYKNLVNVNDLKITGDGTQLSEAWYELYAVVDTIAGTVDWAVKDMSDTAVAVGKLSDIGDVKNFTSFKIQSYKPAVPLYFDEISVTQTDSKPTLPKAPLKTTIFEENFNDYAVGNLFKDVKGDNNWEMFYSEDSVITTGADGYGNALQLKVLSGNYTGSNINWNYKGIVPELDVVDFSIMFNTPADTNFDIFGSDGSGQMTIAHIEKCQIGKTNISADTWYKLNAEINRKTGKGNCKVTSLDDQEVYTASITAKDFCGFMLQSYRVNGEFKDILFDEIKVTQKCGAPNLMADGLAFYRENEKQTDIKAISTVTDKITLTFNTVMNLKSLTDNVKIKTGAAEVSYTAELDDKVFIMTLSEPLKPNTEYTIEIGDGVTAYTGETIEQALTESFKTTEGEMTGKIMSAETKGKTMNITISYINTSDTALNGYVIAAYFNGNKLIKVAYSAEITRDASVKSDTIKCSLTVPDFGSAEQYTSAKLMFWNGLDKMIPITEVYPIK